MAMFCLPSKVLTLGFILASAATRALAFDNTRSDNVRIFSYRNSCNVLTTFSACGVGYVPALAWNLLISISRYWGQNSYGAGHPSDTANYQKTLSAYCQVFFYVMTGIVTPTH